MKISLRWLSDLILWNKRFDPWKNPDSAGRIADRLTQATAEVEHIEQKEFLGLDDIVFHIDNHAITHRPDLFSHIGFARECVAMGLAQWRKTVKKPSLKFPKSPAPFLIFVHGKNLMPRYCACVIEIDALGETPDWMKKRLASVGWRPVNLPVDITNFVSSEIGVPLHSFDLDDLDGDVRMRTARKGEKIQTLDKKEFSLPEGALVLSDNSGIFDLLGIMGGLRSSTKDSTRRIYLHAASLDPVSIRRTVIATGHRTDAATMYEKGIPHITAETGFIRAVELFLELVPGSRLTSKMESIGRNGKPTAIPLSHADLESTLGISIASKNVTHILTNLGCTVKQKTTHYKLRTTNYAITPPLWRLRDITSSHDLIEEVARMYGYNRIPNSIPVASILMPSRDYRKKEIRLALRGLGFVEIVPSPFVSALLLQKCRLDLRDALSIENPLGLDTSLLQPNTLPPLLAHAEKNVIHEEDVFQTFTIAQVFCKDGTEYEELGILYITKTNPPLADHPILKLSSCTQHVFRHLGYPQSKEYPITIKQLHPGICTAFGLSPLSAHAHINLTALFCLPTKDVCFSSLPVFPAITYDLTISWDHQKSVATLLKRLQSSSPLLEGVSVHDLFAQTPNDTSYNLTIRCTYRSYERTLTEEEAQREHEHLTKLARTA